ncbi:MAG: tRNA (adenosine(37)-N6)-threonylcarbamoyltransferase complex dimerization subunit type 1 TsaB [Phaeodactylibacter sp.]|nr:tRNA (adenosine(37)-N6)-threonylcarbamoyltransferase complex dimerization subunit type 1 TsaB [Phaeodactylibacter sp.]MCB9276718.1 tRNA (adenosine(37)-N6)-threonylcarbamoyltransferase complex dimerization subunit type 1 TsaB [Lewinellaceae bacterium]
MALLLLIETATDTCSIGISDGLQMLALHNAPEPYQHASQITLLIGRCLEDSGFTLPEIEGVALSSGPGSYTSLRVGTATAKGICYSLDKPLVVVDTLQSLALASLRQEREDALYFPLIDARRMEAYTAGFDAANERITEAEAIIINEFSFSEYLQAGHTVVLSGNGAAKCAGLLPDKGVIYSETVCSAAHLAPLALPAFEGGRFADIAYYSPFYLKPPNITTPKKLL